MATIKLFFPLLVLFFQLSLAQIEQVGQFQPGYQQQRQSPQRYRAQTECRVERISALTPNRRIESEAGVTEHWEENNEQFECAGVAATRHTIEPRGLHLPSFSNAPRVIYIVQGRGVIGAVIPGCPESFQYSPQSQQTEQERGQRYRDQHQKIRYFRQGDVIALPAGVAYWTYNDGETPVVAVAVHDTSNAANQLDPNLRRFHLAGNERYEGRYPGEPDESLRRGEGEGSGNNLFSGFDIQLLAEAFGVSIETARSLQNQEDTRGNIVRVERGLKIARPVRSEEEEEEERGRYPNGLEQTICTMRLRENIADPKRADVYSPQGGRISSLNSQKLPILNYLQLSVERGVLYRNAMKAPHWNMNAHSVVYCTRGNGRLQIVSNRGTTVFDGELRQEQLVIVPQLFAVVKQAGNEGFEWVSFKTNDNAMSAPLVGRTGVFRSMPEDVLMNSYRISREEARRLKFSRDQEMVILSPRSGSQGRRASA